MDLAMRPADQSLDRDEQLHDRRDGGGERRRLLSRGHVDPFIAAPVAIGVLAGAFLGSRLLTRIENRIVRRLFVATLVIISLQMLVKGIAG